MFCLLKEWATTLKDTPFYLIHGRDTILPQEMFLPLKSTDKRQISSDDLAQYKLKLVQELYASYEKLNSQKIKGRDEYKSYYDRSHKDVSF